MTTTPTAELTAQEVQDLSTLTAIPTAAGREHRVWRWIAAWLEDRPGISVSADTCGNRMLTLNAATPVADPLVMTAHLDHPAFVVTEKLDDLRYALGFRGFVQESFFALSPVRLYRGDADDAPVFVGRIESVDWPEDPMATEIVQKPAIAEFAQKPNAQPGDVVVWDVGETRVEDGLLHTPACDDLAGVFCGLATLDRLLRMHAEGEISQVPDIRMLLTRAEEIAFVGALGACRSGIIPQRARLINIENSKSIPGDSPIGAGPIVRVGDRTSTFDPELTYLVSEAAGRLARQDEGFTYQRKLMPGGICEASAFVNHGYAATGVCLPLGNYHNMNDQTGKIDAEHIALSDAAGMVRLLTTTAVTGLGDNGDAGASKGLRGRLDALWDHRKHVLDEQPLD